MATLGGEKFKTKRRRLSAVNAKEVAHTDQAINAAVRWLITPIPRLCSLALSVTTPLYSTTVSKALRQPLQESFSAPGWANFPKIRHQGGKRCMLASTKPTAHFSRGCRLRVIAHSFLAPHSLSPHCMH